jgi:hypothetical protein
MNTVVLLLQLCFWGTTMQRTCTIAGLALAFSAGLVGLAFWTDTVVIWGLLVVCLPLMVRAGPMWRALSAQRAVLLAPQGRVRLVMAALAVAVVVAMLVAAVLVLSLLPLEIDRWTRMREFMQPETLARNDFSTMALVKRQLHFWRMTSVASFALATWWILAAFCASRSPLVGLIVLILLATVGLGLPRIETQLLVSSYCQDLNGMFCAPVASLSSYLREPRIAPSLVLWTLFALWYLTARRIAPPGWLLPGGQSLLAAAVAGSTSAPPTRADALERLLFGGSGIARLMGQWLLAGLLLLAVLLLLAWRVEPAYAAWVLRAVLVGGTGIVLALSLAARRRARALWLPAALGREQLHLLTRNSLLKLAAGFTLLFALFLLVNWYALPWPAGVTLPQSVVALLAANLLWTALVLFRAEGWLHLAVSAGVLLMLHAGFAAPLLRGAYIGWGWPVTMLAAAAALLLLARRRWMESDLPRRD